MGLYNTSENMERSVFVADRSFFLLSGLVFLLGLVLYFGFPNLSVSLESKQDNYYLSAGIFTLLAAAVALTIGLIYAIAGRRFHRFPTRLSGQLHLAFTVFSAFIAIVFCLLFLWSSPENSAAQLAEESVQAAKQQVDMLIYSINNIQLYSGIFGFIALFLTGIFLWSGVTKKG